MVFECMSYSSNIPRNNQEQRIVNYNPSFKPFQVFLHMYAYKISVYPKQDTKSIFYVRF